MEAIRIETTIETDGIVPVAAVQRGFVTTQNRG